MISSESRMLEIGMSGSMSGERKRNMAWNALESPLEPGYNPTHVC